MLVIILSKSSVETQKIASALAKKVVNEGALRHAQVFALEGELGAGKTTFVKGFARALGVKAHITSPTFVLLKGYRLQITDYRFLYHVDAYRLKDYKELLPLGIKDIISDGKNIVLIEWSDRVRPILPARYTKIHIDHIGQNKRRISVKTQNSNYKF